MCVFVYSTTLSKEFLILRRNVQDVTSVHRYPCKVVVYCCQILMKLGFSRQIFEKL